MSGRVIPDTSIPVEWFRLLDADLTFQAALVKLRGSELRSLSLAAKLGDGRLVVEPLEFEAIGGRVNGRLAIDATSPDPQSELTLRANGFEAGRALALAGYPDVLQSRGNATVELRGQGAALRSVLASSNGEIKVMLGRGRVRAETLDQIVGGVRHLAQSLFGSGGGGWVVLECLAADLRIKDGILTPDLFVADTAVSTVTAKGTVDLGRERLDLLLVPRAKSTTLNFAVPVTLTGTFNAPRVGIDEKAALARLGGIAGAFVFPPAAIASLVDLGDAGNGCVSAAGGSGDIIPRSIDDAAGRAKGVLKDVEKGVRGLFGR
jgi:uncharacterized protein involved in outer membrane biogenesis